MISKSIFMRNILIFLQIQSLRQRLDRADADLVHSRRENLRLSEQISTLEKEVRSTILRTPADYSLSIVHEFGRSMLQKLKKLSLQN